MTKLRLYFLIDFIEMNDDKNKEINNAEFF